MLADLEAHFPVVKKTFAEASDILGFDLWQMTQTDKTRLNQTQNTQPAMLAAGYATYLILKNESNLSPIYMAGHSLGEYTALVAAGALDFATAVKLVRRRSELMSMAMPAGVGAMAAILGLDDKTVVSVCADYSGIGVVEAANFNAPGQVVIAGNKTAVDATCKAMKAVGAKRAMILPVSIASHCSLLNDVAVEFAKDINAAKFRLGEVAVLHNVDAEKADSINAMQTKLVAQLYKPVLWTGTIQTMRALGVEKLIELGPGKVLTKLTKRIDKSLGADFVLDYTSLITTLENIK